MTKLGRQRLLAAEQKRDTAAVTSAADFVAWLLDILLLLVYLSCCGLHYLHIDCGDRTGSG